MLENELEQGRCEATYACAAGLRRPRTSGMASDRGPFPWARAMLAGEGDLGASECSPVQGRRQASRAFKQN